MGKYTTPRSVPTCGKIGLFINRYPPIEKILFDPMRVSTSRDDDIARLCREAREPIFEGKVEGSIQKKFIPIDMSNFKDFGVTRVDGKIKVEKHAHPGTMFNMVIDGRITINGTDLMREDWYLVPPGVPYELDSDVGYYTVWAYDHSC